MAGSVDAPAGIPVFDELMMVLSRRRCGSQPVINGVWDAHVFVNAAVAELNREHRVPHFVTLAVRKFDEFSAIEIILV
jgi:hypothetical protein